MSRVRRRGGRAALAGERSEPEGSVSAGQCIALLKAEVERKLASALIVFSACPRFESSDLPGYSRRWTRLLPQLHARERAAHPGTVSEQCLELNRARFSRQLKPISVQMDSVVRIRPRQPASPVSARQKANVAQTAQYRTCVGLSASARNWRPPSPCRVPGWGRAREVVAGPFQVQPPWPWLVAFIPMRRYRRRWPPGRRPERSTSS
jgi:hypothetical protein